MSKKSFYCWYLGFTNAYGFQSPNRIYDLLQNIIKYQNEINRLKEYNASQHQNSLTSLSNSAEKNENTADNEKTVLSWKASKPQPTLSK